MSIKGAISWSLNHRQTKEAISAIPTRNRLWKTASVAGRDRAKSCWARRSSSSTSRAGWLGDPGRREVPTTTTYSYLISASSPHHNTPPPSLSYSQHAPALA